MSDTLETLRCPACYKVMKKVFSPTEGVNIDICLDGCGGIWFDSREINYFNEQCENIDEIIEAIDGKEFVQVDQTNSRSCPVCGAKMAKTFSSVKKDIQLDECLGCGGKFLDNGELQAIREEHVSDLDRRVAMASFMRSTAEVQLKKLRDRL